MANHHLNHHASDQQFDSSSPSKPYVLIGGLLSGLIGIGVLLLVLVQSLEITVESGNVPEGSPSVAESAEFPSSNGQSNAEQNRATPNLDSDDPRGADSTSEDESNVESSEVAVTEGAIAPGVRVGELRVSNQTTHPLRVALLPQEIAASEEQLNRYSEPVHWDFAPGEGASRGLVLAVPDRGLTLQPGDVVTAFAQDGSQRYWGPFVVGSTSFPEWDNQEGEWTLILRDNL